MTNTVLLFKCPKCAERKRRRKMMPTEWKNKVSLVLVAMLALILLNTATVGYVAYRLLGSELACVPPTEMIERLKEEGQ